MTGSWHKQEEVSGGQYGKVFGMTMFLRTDWTLKVSLLAPFSFTDEKPEA